MFEPSLRLITTSPQYKPKSTEKAI